MGGAIRRLLNRKLSMAFEKWQYEAAKMKAEKEALENALHKFRNSKMFAGWNTWRSWAEDMRRQQHAMKGALRRMICCLHCCTVCNGLIRVDGLVWLLAIEELL